MDVIEKLQKLKDKNKLTDYQIAKNCGLSEGTIYNLFKRNNTPSLSTIEAVCGVFGLSLSQFFLDDNKDFVVLTEEQKEFFALWQALPKTQKNFVNEYVDLLYRSTINHNE